MDIPEMYLVKEKESEVRTSAVGVGVAAVLEELDNEEKVFIDVPSSDEIQCETLKEVQMGQNLTEDMKSELWSVLRQFEDVFTDIPGTAKRDHHVIELVDNSPVRVKTYVLPYVTREELKVEISKMLKRGVINESNSPYSAPVVVVKKKDGSKRICCDLRLLNRITVFDPEPMMTTQTLFTKFALDVYFTKFDLSKRYWQIPIRTEDVCKSGFSTQDGHYHFLKLSFGMVNAGATLVRAMRRILIK